MKRFLILFTIAITCVSLFAATADAKRFGGGSSIGKQRTMSPQQTQTPPSAAPAPAAAPQPAAQPQGNRWLGPLAGLAIGAGLGALFAHLGLGEGMGMLLMIVLGAMVVMFLVSMFRRAQPQPAYAGRMPSGAEPMQHQPMSSGSAVAASSIPADFPVEAFLRSAKTSFIRLQAANDRKDLNDIREYTTPEMFAEISMQISERDNTPQKTDVIGLTTDLLEVANEGDYAIASVRMRGQLSENNGAPEAFDEVWHVQKDLRDPKAVWLLSGIQQVA